MQSITVTLNPCGNAEENEQISVDVVELQRVDKLFKLIINDSYDDAVKMSKKLYDGDVISKVVKKLTTDTVMASKLMAYGYKLWNDGGRDLVIKHFPYPFQHIFEQNKMTIVNRGYNQALKLDVNLDRDDDRVVWGDNHDQTSKRVSWKFIPVWLNNELTFKVYNFDCNMYLKLGYGKDNIGDRGVFGAKASDSGRHRFYLEPYMDGETLVFFIINHEYRQGLKLGVGQDHYGDRKLWGHNGDIYVGEKRYQWILRDFAE